MWSSPGAERNRQYILVRLNGAVCGLRTAATVLDDIINNCITNGAMGGTNETFTSKQGLSIQVAFEGFG
jgi:hypothetical protein